MALRCAALRSAAIRCDVMILLQAVAGADALISIISVVEARVTCLLKGASLPLPSPLVSSPKALFQWQHTASWHVPYSMPAYAPCGDPVLSPKVR